jgi:hypothetical protein
MDFIKWQLSDYSPYQLSGPTVPSDNKYLIWSLIRPTKFSLLWIPRTFVAWIPTAHSVTREVQHINSHIAVAGCQAGSRLHPAESPIDSSRPYVLIHKTTDCIEKTWCDSFKRIDGDIWCWYTCTHTTFHFRSLQKLMEFNFLSLFKNFRSSFLDVIYIATKNLT